MIVAQQANRPHPHEGIGMVQRRCRSLRVKSPAGMQRPQGLQRSLSGGLRHPLCEQRNHRGIPPLPQHSPRHFAMPLIGMIQLRHQLGGAEFPEIDHPGMRRILRTEAIDPPTGNIEPTSLRRDIPRHIRLVPVRDVSRPIRAKFQIDRAKMLVR